MHVENITSNAMSLDRNGQSMLIQVYEKEIERLNNIIDTMLEFSFFKEECPLNFGFGDGKEEKAQDVFYEDDYCEENCNDIYKKCWLKYFEKLQELRAQQKVEQLEKENEHLRTQVNTYENPNDLTLFYMWLDEKAKDKIKQLENIRKKALECINEWLFEAGGNGADMDYDTIVDLLNILNKGDNNGK